MKALVLTGLIAALVGIYGCGGTQQLSPPAPATQSQDVSPLEPPDTITKSCGAGFDPGQQCIWWVPKSGPMDIDVVYEETYSDVSGLFYAKNTLYEGSGKSVYVLVKRKYRYTLTGLSGTPLGIAADRKGTVWVSNTPSNVLSEFPPHKTKPTATYTDANLTSLSYVAVDRFNNVYVEGQGTYGIEVDELSPASGGFTPIGSPGELGNTAGGLAFQKSKTGSYLWINDQGTSSASGSITQWLFQNGGLKKVGSFAYAGTNGAIWADPEGKGIKRVFATNNVASGSYFENKGVEYAMPSGDIVSESNSSMEAALDVGIAGAHKY